MGLKSLYLYLTMIIISKIDLTEFKKYANTKNFKVLFTNNGQLLTKGILWMPFGLFVLWYFKY